MPRAYINIGSNIGDRRANIARAVTAVSALPVSDLRISALYSSKPWGYDSPNDYLNQGVSFDTPLAPEALLQALLEIERSINVTPHRTPEGEYADRVLDIDLIAMEGTRMSTAGLTLPHPRASQRDFVMKPLIETLKSI